MMSKQVLKVSQGISVNTTDLQDFHKMKRLEAKHILIQIRENIFRFSAFSSK